MLCVCVCIVHPGRHCLALQLPPSCCLPAVRLRNTRTAHIAYRIVPYHALPSRRRQSPGGPPCLRPQPLTDLQTRGWFYTLMVLSTALFDKPAFKNLVCNGLVLAADGKKMSKRLKNYPVCGLGWGRPGALACPRLPFLLHRGAPCSALQPTPPPRTHTHALASAHLTHPRHPTMFEIRLRPPRSTLPNPPMQDPMEVVNKHGADALRLYLINSPVVRARLAGARAGDGLCRRGLPAAPQAAGSAALLLPPHTWCLCIPPLPASLQCALTRCVPSRLLKERAVCFTRRCVPRRSSSRRRGCLGW